MDRSFARAHAGAVLVFARGTTLAQIVVLLGLLWLAWATAARAQDRGHPDAALTPPVLRLGGEQVPTWQGAPTLVVWLIDIDAEGWVSNARLVEPASALEMERGQIEQRCEAYVRGLRFEPAARNGVPVPARIRFQHLLAQEAVTATLLAPPAGPPKPAAPPPPDYGAAAVVDAPLQATSSVDLSGTSLRRRTYFNAGDLLNGVPGFYVVQHGGGAKAQQYFIRGFDADHGTDVALYVEDVPINAPTHGHGQGYSDLNWVIPELVETLEVRKGPYFAEYGDFSTAGTVNYRLKTSLSKSFVTGTVGMFNAYRGVAAAKLSSGSSAPLFAAEVYKTDGPFTHPEGYHRISLISRGSERLGNGVFTWTLQSYLAAWHASGQIPARAVGEGLISRFGSIDPNEGGNAQRHSLTLDYRRRLADRSEFHLTTFLVRNRLDLYSNFGFYSEDPIDGDMIRQVDDRVYAGMRASWVVDRQLDDLRVLSRFGTQARYDDTRPRVSHAPGRVVTTPITASNVDLVTASLFAELDARWSHWLRGVGAVRYDASLAQVQDRLADADANQRTGERFAGIVNPKLSLIVHAHEDVDLYANFGSGYHSNDARGTVLRGPGRVSPFARALAYELGAKLGGASRYQLSWAGYIVNLTSETVFVGEDGTTEPRGKTHRVGTELTGSVGIVRWLKWDGSVSYSHAAFVDNAGNGNSVALAPRWLMQSGLEAEHESGLSGRLTLFFVGDRPATEDDALTAQGFLRLDATAEYKHDWYGAQIALQNLTNAVYKQAQFAGITRLKNETSCPAGTRSSTATNGAFMGCEDITFTPGLPLTVMASLSLYF